MGDYIGRLSKRITLSEPLGITEQFAQSITICQPIALGLSIGISIDRAGHGPVGGGLW